MLWTVLFFLLGYLLGSVLFAQVGARLFHKQEIILNSKDHNPGTTNAFIFGGFRCGVFTLIGDLLKGFIPVFIYLRCSQAFQVSPLFSGLVIAAPVIGHAFPLFYQFKGGKGIAASFGCLLGLFPLWQPAVILAGAFIFFSVVFCITPHFYRTIVAYLCALPFMLFTVKSAMACLGFVYISGVVFTRLFFSKEEKEKLGVKPLWTH